MLFIQKNIMLGVLVIVGEYSTLLSSEASILQ